jgi:hypothetical protein
LKMTAFWVVASCSLEDVYRRWEVLAASIIRRMSKPRARKFLDRLANQFLVRGLLIAWWWRQQSPLKRR